MRIVVTGGSGKAGRWVVRDLREHGHYVTNVDTRHDGSEHGLCLLADLADYGQTAEALAGYDAVDHLAAIPAPGLRPPADTFRNNVLSTYNVFAAAEANHLERVVWASSETVLGLPFDTPPQFAPIDETIEPRPETSYALDPYLVFSFADGAAQSWRCSAGRRRIAPTRRFAAGSGILAC